MVSCERKKALRRSRRSEFEIECWALRGEAECSPRRGENTERERERKKEREKERRSRSSEIVGGSSRSTGGG